MNCPFCGAQEQTEGRFCASCAQRLPDACGPIVPAQEKCVRPYALLTCAILGCAYLVYYSSRRVQTAVAGFSSDFHPVILSARSLVFGFIQLAMMLFSLVFACRLLGREPLGKPWRGGFMLWALLSLSSIPVSLLFSRADPVMLKVTWYDFLTPILLTCLPVACFLFSIHRFPAKGVKWVALAHAVFVAGIQLYWTIGDFKAFLSTETRSIYSFAMTSIRIGLFDVIAKLLFALALFWVFKNNTARTQLFGADPDSKGAA